MVSSRFSKSPCLKKMSVLEDDIHCWPVAATVAHTGTHINTYDF